MNLWGFDFASKENAARSTGRIFLLAFHRVSRNLVSALDNQVKTKICLDHSIEISSTIFQITNNRTGQILLIVGKLLNVILIPHPAADIAPCHLISEKTLCPETVSKKLLNNVECWSGNKNKKGSEIRIFRKVWSFAKPSSTPHTQSHAQTHTHNN